MTEPRQRVYSDASPLIALARIGRLELLRLLGPPIYVTSGVWGEVTADSSQPGVPALERAKSEGLLRVVTEGSADDFPQLDAGEAETLSAALAAKAAFIVDERKAERLLRTNPRLVAGIPAHLSTVALLLIAKRDGAIPAIQPLLDALRRETFRITTALYERALRDAGEWPP